MSGVSRAVRWLPLAALLFGVAFVALYDFALAPVRLAYAHDSASYVEMASSLLHEGRPLVTPWELEPADRDAIPQRLFPPGFAVVVAALTPLTGDVRTAVVWPPRVAAAVLPLLIVLLFRGALPDLVLAGVAAFVGLSGGVRYWQYIAYSDVPALLCAVVAMGALARGLGYVGGVGTRSRAWLLLAGAAAATGYAVRNAALAVLVASLFMLLYQLLRERRGFAALGCWLLGAAPPLVALIAYNVATFGQWQPYTMPASVRPWRLNMGDYALAVLNDSGLPTPLPSEVPPAGTLGWALLFIVIALGLGYACWHSRAHRRRHGLLMLLCGYAAAGAVLLIASRSRYEWGNLIEARNTLQYTWALVFAIVLAADALLGRRARGAAAVLGAIALAALLVSSVGDVRAAWRAGPEAWLRLARDPAVMQAARAVPPGTLMASNAGALFRLGAGRAVRQLDVGGEGDRDLQGSLEVLARTAAPRPAVFLLVCDEWSGRFSVCGGRSGPDTPHLQCTVVRSVFPRVASCRP